MGDTILKSRESCDNLLKSYHIKDFMFLFFEISIQL